MTDAAFARLFAQDDDLTTAELLDALESTRGQRVLTGALRETVTDQVTAVLRAAFAGHAPDVDDKTIRPSQKWLFDTVAEVRARLDAADG